MMCPFCGKTMRQGYVVTENSRGLFFLPPDQSLGFLLSDKRVEDKGGIVLDGPYHLRENSTRLPAFLCELCRKVLFDY